MLFSQVLSVFQHPHLDSVGAEMQKPKRLGFQGAELAGTSKLSTLLMQVIKESRGDEKLKVNKMKAMDMMILDSWEPRMMTGASIHTDVRIHKKTQFGGISKPRDNFLMQYGERSKH